MGGGARIMTEYNLDLISYLWVKTQVFIYYFFTDVCSFFALKLSYCHIYISM